MKLITDHPVAVASADHIHPRGAMQDNTHSPRFVDACRRVFTNPSLLDLGCAGGGLVKDFLDAGLQAYGLEGSDFPKTAAHGEWSRIPENLFCCDITKPFTLTDDGRAAFQFDVISAWEVLEHIQENDLPQFFQNIVAHLKYGGVFVASIATYPDETPDAKYHVTIKDAEWWENQFSEHGLRPIRNSYFFHDDFPRGSGNPLALGDWNSNVNPEMGFHIVAELIE